MKALTSLLAQRPPRWWLAAAGRARRANLFLWLEIAFALIFVAIAWTTYAVFASAPADGEPLPSTQIAPLLVGALIPAMGLLVLFGRRMALRRAAGSTARLHVRLVFLFSLIAAGPTLLFAAFAAFLFQAGVDFWFSDESRALMDNANALASGYYEQNQLDVGNETIAMAGDLRAYLEQGPLWMTNSLRSTVTRPQGRDISESVILQEFPDRSLRTAAVLDLRDDNNPTIFVTRNLPSLQAGETVFVEGGPSRIEAIAPIDAQAGIYLYNARNSQTNNFNYWKTSGVDLGYSYDQLTNRARALPIAISSGVDLGKPGLAGPCRMVRAACGRSAGATPDGIGRRGPAGWSGEFCHACAGAHARRRDRPIEPVLSIG